MDGQEPWAGISWDILGLDLGDPSKRAAGVLQGLLLQAEHRWRSSALLSCSLYYSCNLCEQRLGGRARAGPWFLRESWLPMWIFKEHIFPLPECHPGAAPWPRAPTFQRNQLDPAAFSQHRESAGQQKLWGCTGGSETRVSRGESSRESLKTCLRKCL